MRKVSFSARPVFLLFVLVGVLTGGVFYKTFEAEIADALSAVSLNNGVTTLDDAVSLSSQEDLSVGEIGAYTWTKDSANLMSLNMPFNSGATQNDYSGNGNNGAVTDALVTTVGCQVGTCLSFDGNADYVTIPDSPVWNFSDELTVSMWFSSTQADIGGQALVSQGESSGQYSFLMWASGGLTDDNMSFYIQTNPAGITSVGCSAAEGTLFDGEWHHYLGVYDRAENELRMYIDGAPACNTLAVVNQPLIDYAGGVHLGRLPFSTSYTNGILDEVQVYSEVLSEAQIDRLYTDGAAQTGGPTIIEDDETTVGEVWDLIVTPITTAGTPGSPIDSANTVTITGVLPPPPPPALGVDLCTSGGEAADDRLDAGETSFDGMTVSVVNCTFTINGEHTFANITIGNGVGSNDSILNHTATTTTDVFKLQLTITGSTVIDSDGIINLDGRGFPRGYTTNGVGGVTAQTGVSGNCGGSHGGYGGCQSPSNVYTPVYGSISQPLDPGAGAFISSTGTAGGGYLKLTTDHLIVNGTISVNGNPSAASTGAGGGVWITSSGSVSVAGIIRANGGSGVNGFHGSGAGGRIAFHYDGSAYSNPTPHGLFANIQAQTGAPGGVNATNVAAAGTIYIEDTSSHVSGEGSLFAKNNAGLTPSVNMFTPVSGDYHDLRIQDRATIVTSTIDLAGDLDINNLGVLTHPFTTTSVVNRLLVTVAGETNIEAGGSINVSGRGFLPGYTSDGAGGATTTGASTPNSGGSYGGRGGVPTGSPGVPALTYDDFKEPTEPGGGAGNGTTGVGGGYVKLVTGSLMLHGTINADGALSSSEGGVSSGAGGGLWLIVSNTVDISGTIRANGGQGPANNFHAYGGGGRIALSYDSSAPGNPSVISLRPSFTAASGSGSVSTSYGSAGTIYFEDSATHSLGEGDLYISNANLTGATTETPLSGTLPNLIIENGAKVIATTLLVTRDFSMTGSSVLAHPATTTSTVYRLDVTVDGDTTIDSTSSINVVGRGFLVGYTSNGSGGTTTVGASLPNSGGSHGGNGGSAGGTPGVVYGNFRQPTESGGGAGNGSSGFGGGALKWTTGDLTLDGTVNVSASSGASVSSGAGGSVWITASGSVSLTGNIYANGGPGPSNNFHAYGSGGRIAIYYDGDASANLDVSDIKSQLHASTGSGTGSTLYGAAGTIYVEDLSEHVVGQGAFIVDNSNFNAGSSRTPLFVVGQGYTTVTVDDLYVNDLGDLLIDTPCDSGSVFTVLGTIDLTGGGVITNNQSGTCTLDFSILDIATTSLPNAYPGVPYSQNLLLSGGYAPIVWSIIAGSLPDGLSMNPSSGEITGTPTQNGVNVFTVRVTDNDPGGAQTDDQELTITVTDVPTVPGAINLNATAGGEQVFLTWSAPNANGSAITDYVVQYGTTAGFPGNAITFNDGVSASTGAAVTGLTNDIEYSFRVAAVNGVGQGPYSDIESATPSVSAASQLSSDAQITVDINDFLSFSIANLAVGDEAAGDQPFGAGAEITGLTSTGNNDYAISGEFGPPVFTRLQTTTNSNDGYNVIAYATNLDGRTNTLLRLGATPGNAADEMEDSLNRLPSSQAPNEALVPASDSGLAFRLINASTSSIIREADEDTQWGDGDAGTALWASFPLGSGAAQVIYDTLTYSSTATTAYLNWFVGISPQQRSGAYSGQVTFTASVN
jgi:hypothetical protein